MRRGGLCGGKVKIAAYLNLQLEKLKKTYFLKFWEYLKNRFNFNNCRRKLEIIQFFAILFALNNINPIAKKFNYSNRKIGKTSDFR